LIQPQKNRGYAWTLIRQPATWSHDLTWTATTGRPKGQRTVELLQLDRREALAAGYRRLAALVECYLNESGSSTDSLVAALRDADDHGLAGWCFMGIGQNVPPFRDLRERQPDAWATCLAACQQTKTASIRTSITVPQVHQTPRSKQA